MAAGRLMDGFCRGRLAPFEGWYNPHRLGILIESSS